MRKFISTLLLIYTRIKSFVLEKTDPALLLFLLFLFNYRFSFKIIAIVGIYLYRPNFKIKLNGIVVFYVSMIALGIINILFVHRDYSLGHFMIVLAGCLIWLTCLLAYHQVNLAVSRNKPLITLNTLKLFALANFIVSLFDIIKVMLITGSLNPYTQICPPPYGISSGDVIGGIFGQVHLVNTVISCFLLIFFIYQNSFLFAVICLIPFLLTGSNLATLILCALLIFIILIKKDILLKYYAIFCILLIVIFYIKITPSNKDYLIKILTKVQYQFVNKVEKPIEKPLATDTNGLVVKKKLSKEELIYAYIQYKTKLANKKEIKKNKASEQVIFTSMYATELKKSQAEKKQLVFTWYKKDSLKNAKSRNEFFDYGHLKRFDLEKEPGKITSFKQTKAYLSQSWQNALFGSGIGSFSSRLAFITSGIADDSRILKALPKYQTEDFKENHKAIFKYLMFLDDETHSITNLPFSWYNGVFGEYGIIGFIVFVTCYLGFFFKRFSLLSYGKLLLVSIIAFFFFDYWFERLSVIMLFELLMLLDIKMKTLKKEVNT